MVRSDASPASGCGLLFAGVICGAFRWSFLEAVPPWNLGDATAGVVASGFLPRCSHCRMISLADMSDEESSQSNSMISGGT
jgi:hypothetical protein